MDIDTDFIVNTFDEFGILSAGDDLINSLNCGEVIEDFGPISIPETEFENKLKKIESIISKYVKSEQESSFWSILINKDIPPTLIELLCLYLVSKDLFFQYGVKIYSILLCSEQCSKIWSPILFSPILKTLITSQQIIENGAKLNSQTKSQLTLAADILKRLSINFSGRFANLIGSEILMALCELIVKLIGGIRVELDQFNTVISNEALNTAKKICETNLDNLLPFLVPALLLNFASNSSSLTTRIEKIRGKLLSFIQSILKPDDERVVLLCKHLMMRSPDKAFLKKSAAYVVYSLTKYSINAKEIITFALKLGRTSKVHLRSFASYLLQLYIVNINDLSIILGRETSELVLEMSDIIKSLLSDPAPTVRSTALDCLTSIIENLKDNDFGSNIKHVIDSSGSLETVLRHRIYEEKLIVRRSALLCLTQIVISNARSITPIMIKLISSRIRDRAVSMRTLAIKSLNSAVERFPNNELLNNIWLDSILPSVLDPENSVQMEAFEAIKNFIFTPLIDGESCHFTSIMTSSHFDFMKNVFNFCKQKAISLAKISNAFSNILFNYYNNDSDENEQTLDESTLSVWKLVSILTSIESSHFKSNKYFDLWYNFKKLPSEYFAILANLKFKDNEITDDLITYLNDIISTDSRKYHLVHSLLQLIHVQDNSEYVFSELLKNWSTIINDVAQSNSANQSELEGIATTIFAFGELIALIPKSSFINDFNYTGLQLLFSSKLPNGEQVPTQVCALSVITLGKLCLAKKDLSRSFVAAFAHLLSSKESAPIIKCNCLIVLCDLCVAYSALVEPYVKMITQCFADNSPLVRHQTLILLTRLIIEDYMKMSSVMFFRYIYAMTDKDQTVSSFAINCLLNVIMNKFPDLIKSHFMEALYYFSNETSSITLDETDEERKLFQIKSRQKRHLALSLLISRMDNTVAFKMTESICKNLFSKFISEEYNITNHSTILDDSIFSLVELEEKMDQSLELDVAPDDAATENVIEMGKKIVADIRNSIIQSVMPTLNKMHRLLRDKHSPLQTQLKVFYCKVCAKNPDFINKLEKSEPLLAVELKYEMEETPETFENEEAQNESDDEGEEEDKNENRRSLNESLIQTPTKALFESSLLSRIATTPRSLLCTPYKKPEGNREIVPEPEILENSDSESGDEAKENDHVLETPKVKKVHFRIATPPHDPSLLD